MELLLTTACLESKTRDKGAVILLDGNLVFGMKRGLMRGTSPQMKIFENKIHFGKNACFIFCWQKFVSRLFLLVASEILAKNGSQSLFTFPPVTEICSRRLSGAV